MNAPSLDAKINLYKRKIEKLDSLSGKLSKQEQTNYRSVRQRFIQRLQAWQQTLGSDLAAFENNVEEGYHELEAYLISKK